MNREVAWIKTALDRDRTKTQSGLAKALSIDKSSVSRLLRGERRLKFAEARLAAGYLGVDPPVGFAESGDEFEHRDATEIGGRGLAPLFRAEAAKDGFWTLDRKTVAERKPRGPQLIGASSVFGFYAPDNAMAPRFKVGEIAWVNPVRPVAPGDDAVLLARAKKGGVEIMLLCELQKTQKGRYWVRQHSDGADREFSSDEWDALYVYPRG